MSCFFKFSKDTSVHIPNFVENDNVIFYEIKVKVKDVEWITKHRYRDFNTLHEKLVHENSISKKLLPPKKVIGNKDRGFIEQRQKELEEYLQNLLGIFRITMPRAFVVFLEFNKYDIVFLLHDMAHYFNLASEGILNSIKEYHFSVLELHAITERTRLPCPPNDEKDTYDFSHVLDFCSQIENIIVSSNSIKGSSSDIESNHISMDIPIGTSNLRQKDLNFDFNTFRNLHVLKMYGVSSENLTDVSWLKQTIEAFHFYNTKVSKVNEILMCDTVHKNDVENTLKWERLQHIDFSKNLISEIDSSITLAPKLKVLQLSGNRLTNITHLSALSELRELYLSSNLISECINWHTELGNLVTLDLSENKIRCLVGLKKMYSLVILDLSCNLISDLDEVENVAALPLLEDFRLTGNPLATSVDYRARVLAKFRERAGDIYLDNEKGSPKELDMALVFSALDVSATNAKNS